MESHGRLRHECSWLKKGVNNKRKNPGPLPLRLNLFSCIKLCDVHSPSHVVLILCLILHSPPFNFFYREVDARIYLLKLEQRHTPVVMIILKTPALAVTHAIIQISMDIHRKADRRNGY